MICFTIWPTVSKYTVFKATSSRWCCSLKATISLRTVHWSNSTQLTTKKSRFCSEMTFINRFLLIWACKLSLNKLMKSPNLTNFSSKSAHWHFVRV